MGYVSSAKNLLETGTLTYHNKNEPTVHIMPGQTFLLALVFIVFGTANAGIYAAKLLMILIGIASVYITFLIGKSLNNERAGLIAAFLYAIFIPLVLTNNLLLTETPFMFSMLLMIFFSIRLANEHKMKDFYFLMIFYFLSIMFKATIAMYPVILLLYFIMKKYPFKLALRQLGIAIILSLIVLAPWWIRNYVQFNEFIPLTGGAGNPLLLGSYQGHGYKYGEPYKVVLERINQENPGMNALGKLRLQEIEAKERISEWWNLDHQTFLETYINIKTKLQWETHFYWIEIFNVSSENINTFHLIILYTFLASTLFVPFSKHWKEYLFFLFIILYFTVLNDIYYAYSRYNQPLMPLLFLFIGMLITTLLNAIRNLIREKSPTTVKR